MWPSAAAWGRIGRKEAFNGTAGTWAEQARRRARPERLRSCPVYAFWRPSTSVGSLARELTKTRLCERLGAFQSASDRQREAARESPHQYSPRPARASQSLWKEYEQTLQEARARRERDWARYRDAAAGERRRLKSKYRQQRHLLAALPVSGGDRKRLFQQLELRQTIETRALKQKHATQRRGIQKTPHPGTWQHFVATRAAERDARAIRLLKSRQREPVHSGEEREL